MAIPTCPKTGCGSTAFFAQLISVGTSVAQAVCCMSCGTVVGLLDAGGTDAAVIAKLERIEKQLAAVHHEVR